MDATGPLHSSLVGVSLGCHSAANSQQVPCRLPVSPVDGPWWCLGPFACWSLVPRSLEMSQGDRVIGRIGTEIFGVRIAHIQGATAQLPDDTKRLEQQEIPISRASRSPVI